MEIKNVFELAKAGDEGAKELIFNEFYTPIFRYVRMRVKRKEDAEDLTQTIFFKLFSNLKNMTPAAPKSLLFTIARNTIIDYWRTRRDFIDIDEHVDTLSIDSRRASNEQMDLIKVLSQLSQGEQEILELYYFSGLDTKTIASITNKKEDNIRQIRSRSIEKIRQILKKENYE